MRLRIASDLHLEFFRHIPTARLDEHFLPDDERDSSAVLVLAGDISSDIDQLADFLERACRRFSKVIYVPGNHEYYRHDYIEWNARAHQRLRGPGLIVALGCARIVEIDGIRFVVATLWGDGGDTPEEAAAIGNYLNDFRLIGYRGKAFTVQDMRELHEAQREAIHVGVTVSDMPVVVVTHHMPSYSLSHPRFGNTCTGGFAGKLDDLLTVTNAPSLWVHGHKHDTGDRVCGLTRVVCNPAGYVPEWNTDHNRFFAAPMFVEVA